MGKEAKKRKQQDGDVQEPLERQKLAKITVTTEQENATGCVLACFSDAPPPSDILKDDEGGVIFELKRNKKKGTRTLSGESDRLVFEGTDNAEHGAFFKYIAAIYDAEKEKITLVDPGTVSGGNVISLNRRVKGMKNHASPIKAMSKEQARDALVGSFGSKRVKSVHKQRKGVELQKEGDESMEAVERELRVKKEEAEAAREAAGIAKDSGDSEGPNELAPPCNLSADALDKVYGEHSLLTDAEWETVPVSKLLQACKEPDSEAAKLLPLFVREQLPDLAKTDKKKRKSMAKVLAFASSLISFSNLPSRLSKGSEFVSQELNTPPAFALLLLKTFAVADGKAYTRPQTRKDKLLLYLGVAALLACDHHLSIDSLAADLRLHPDKLSSYFKELGATVTKVKGTKAKAEGGAVGPKYKVALKLPLVFPKKSRGGPKR